MEPRELLRQQLAGGEWTLLEALDGLTQEDFLVQLPHAGESVDWVLGHLAMNEDFFLSALTGAPLEMPASLHGVYRDGFPAPDHRPSGKSRDELITLFVDQRRRVEKVLAGDDSDWSAPPPGGFPAIFPSRGAIWGLFATHMYWHIGQVMSIRAMLQKPTFSFAGAPNLPQRREKTPMNTSNKLIMPKDGPRVPPRLPEQVSPYVRAELDKATEVWGIPNHLARTMACHPLLAKTEVDYANSFIFQRNVYAEMPRPGKPGETVLFPEAGFIDRVTKELVISLVSLVNRSRYSITHHGFISYMVLSNELPGTPAEKQRRAEAMLLHLVDDTGAPAYEGKLLDGKPLYSDLQKAAFRVALKTNSDPHSVTDEDITTLRELLREDARAQIAAGPLASQFAGAEPDAAYLEAYADAMMVELTWNIVHFSGLLNRWFTLLKVRDEEFAVSPDGSSFVDAYNTIPESLRARNNALLGPDGWGGQ